MKCAARRRLPWSMCRHAMLYNVCPTLKCVSPSLFFLISRARAYTALDDRRTNANKIKVKVRVGSEVGRLSISFICGAPTHHGFVELAQLMKHRRQVVEGLGGVAEHVSLSQRRLRSAQRRAASRWTTLLLLLLARAAKGFEGLRLRLGLHRESVVPG